jgi:hypothetical protein
MKLKLMKVTVDGNGKTTKIVVKRSCKPDSPCGTGTTDLEIGDSKTTTSLRTSASVRIYPIEKRPISCTGPTTPTFGIKGIGIGNSSKSKGPQALAETPVEKSFVNT